MDNILPILSLTVMVLHSVQNIRWSSKFEKAKNAELAAKDAQIAGLNQNIQFMSTIYSDKTMDYLGKQKILLEEQLEKMSSELDVARKTLQANINELTQLRHAEEQLNHVKYRLEEIELQWKPIIDHTSILIEIRGLFPGEIQKPNIIAPYEIAKWFMNNHHGNVYWGEPPSIDPPKTVIETLKNEFPLIGERTLLDATDVIEALDEKYWTYNDGKG